MHPVDPLSVLHLPSPIKHNKHNRHSKTNIHLCVLRDGQPFRVTARMEMTLTLSGCVEANIQHELYRGRGPNEAFIWCLSKVMKRACRGPVRYDWINSVFQQVVWYMFPHQWGSFGRSNRPHDCVFVMYALVKSLHAVSSEGGRRGWRRRSEPQSRQTRISYLYTLCQIVCTCGCLSSSCLEVVW